MLRPLFENMAKEGELQKKWETSSPLHKACYSANIRVGREVGVMTMPDDVAEEEGG